MKTDDETKGRILEILRTVAWAGVKDSQLDKGVELVLQAIALQKVPPLMSLDAKTGKVLLVGANVLLETRRRKAGGAIEIHWRAEDPDMDFHYVWHVDRSDAYRLEEDIGQIREMGKTAFGRWWAKENVVIEFVGEEPWKAEESETEKGGEDAKVGG